MGMTALRPVFGEALASLGRIDPRVVALTADVSTSDYSYMFGEEFPDRYFNVGIAEQCLVDVSVGLAATGLVPFANTFAVFMASRAFEPILTHLAYGQANVKLMAGYSGLSPQMEGPSHHAITDLAVMRALPGMAVISPADATALRALLPKVANHVGPVYFRFCRNEVEDIYDETFQPELGKAQRVRDGDDVTLVGVGTQVGTCVEAAGLLEKRGIQARVIDLYSVKPLDTEEIVSAAVETSGIVTVEEHNVLGGIGSAIAEVVSASESPCRIRRIGLDDRFASSGAYYDMLKFVGLSAQNVAAAAEGLLNHGR